MHAWCKDACAVWLHSSAILGLAGLGLAFGHHDLIVFCGGRGRYRTLTLLLLIPLLRGFYFRENILSDVHTLSRSTFLGGGGLSTTGIDS